LSSKTPSRKIRQEIDRARRDRFSATRRRRTFSPTITAAIFSSSEILNRDPRRRR
jgi:hypothetical protein